jgi:hypothetical protein
MDEYTSKHEVRVHIDQAPYHSPNPTTGAALYALGDVRLGHELYREVSGNREDAPVPNDDSPVNLREDEHFHSAERRVKEFKIIVNGTQHIVTNAVVTFDQLTEITFPGHPNTPDIVFSVTFEKAASKPHHGTLAEGGTVTVKNGTIFDVTQTNRS